MYYEKKKDSVLKGKKIITIYNACLLIENLKINPHFADTFYDYSIDLKKIKNQILISITAKRELIFQFLTTKPETESIYRCVERKKFVLIIMSKFPM